MGGKPQVAITIGDVAGVGSEVTLKAIEGEIFSPPPLIIGDYAFLSEEAERLSLNLSLIRIDEGAPLPDAEVPVVLDLKNLPKRIERGKVVGEYGRCAWEYLKKAVALAKEGKIKAIVTAPVNKTSLHAISFPFPGQTEFFASSFGVSDYAMMLSSGNYRVVLLTTHLSLAEALAHIKKDEIIRLAKLVDKELKNRFGIRKPKIAISALNPHAGEGGAFGDEEIKEIRPAIEKLKKRGIEASGPFPADTLFHPENWKRFDAVIALYHDQGMIPIKTLFFDRAVNITLGLPIIRTSPDHGTAFDIAGKGIANPNSMMEAIKIAYHLSKIKVG